MATPLVVRAPGLFCFRALLYDDVLVQGEVIWPGGAVLSTCKGRNPIASNESNTHSRAFCDIKMRVVGEVGLLVKFVGLSAVSAQERSVLGAC